MRCLLLVALLAGFAGLAAAQFSSCSASGDPHFKTFDNTYHDFQGAATWVMARTDDGAFEVHSQFLPCNTPSLKVTCIRSTTVKVTDAQGNPSVIKYGVWGGRFDDIIVANLTYTLAQLKAAAVTVGGRFSVSVNAANQLILSNPRNPNFEVLLGASYLVVKVPSTSDEFRGRLNGLCGFFDGSPETDFVFPNGTTAFKTVNGGRYNTAAMYGWGAHWVVDGSAFNPILSHFHAHHDPFTVQAHPTLMSVPTPDEQAALEKIELQTAGQLTALTARCRAITDDQAALENCVYDAAAIPDDFVLAGANAAAAAAASATPSSSSSSSDKTGLGVGLGVGLGLVALVAVVVAVVTYVRFRRLQSAHSTALIELNNARGSQGTGSDMNIPLNENV